MLQNQLCENININNEDFSILDATVVENDPKSINYSSLYLNNNL
ncbi:MULTISPECIES: hypothetical protein, partial [unclassified Wolbachia]